MSEVTKNEIAEVGLVLPNGEVVWAPDEYRNFPLRTREERAHLLTVIQKVETEMGFAPGTLVSQYKWRVRIVQTITVVVDYKETSQSDLTTPVDITSGDPVERVDGVGTNTES